jgi:peptide chain release factor 2
MENCLDNYSYTQLIKNLEDKINNIRNIIKPEEIKNRLEEIKNLELDNDFWNDANKAKHINQEKIRISRVLEKFNLSNELFCDSKELFDIASNENDEETINELFLESSKLEECIQKAEIEAMLSDELDNLNAIITIHPGAGGTESQDWASMIYRMYSRWAERSNFKIEVLDYQAGDEAGIKDVSFILKGENAYGYLKLENGIHRLVRISPFDTNEKTHTSFCSEMISPEIDDNIDIQIEDNDIRIDTYRASGAGGQHVNKTESAIRITHLETNVVVQCQNDRSQHKNKANAMKMLKSKLYELELEKQHQEKNSKEKSDIGWGHQIRSYVLQPYQQVKDLRTNIGYSQVSNILDGDITKLIEDNLVFNKSK